MVYVDTPMTSAVREAVEVSWGLPCVGDVIRLPGGEESAAYRVGSHVVRIGPEWRSDAELEWSYAMTFRVAGDVPEVTAPLPTSGGFYVARAEGRPVSVWPFVEGSWADHKNDDQRDQAADLIARLHRAFANLKDVTPRPGRADLDGRRGPSHPDVEDPDLDRWLADFMERRSTRQPLHGDVYEGNVLVREGRVVALVDWDDVFLGPPEQELAWAAAEWAGLGLCLDLSAALRFIDTYVAAGGTAERIEAPELAQLVRGRIRMGVDYGHAAGQWGTSEDPEEREYEANQLKTFRALRP